MPRVQLPAVTPKRKAWNKGRIIGQKRPLFPIQVWAIRAQLVWHENQAVARRVQAVVELLDEIVRDSRDLFAAT